jgi:hypothetical protein
MGNFRPCWWLVAQGLLLSAATFFFCGTALAQVNGFVVVNPIVVCDSNGANCPTFGVQCSTNTSTGAYSCTQFNSPSTATVNTPIGVVDGDNNINLTRAIMAAQAGIDVAFFPVQQYNSPNTNKDPWTTITPTYSTTSYQHLHLKTVICKSGTVQASPDLAALTQHQICTEFGGVKGISNPPAAPSPAPPLASTLGESNALDVFFVTDFPGNAVYGISWINGDGVSIGSTATFSSPAKGPGPRFDVLAHEIGHALALDHNTFGLTTALNNLMTTGSSRTIPSTSGCSIETSTKVYGTNSYNNPNGGVLYDLGDPAVYPSPVPTLYGTFKSDCPPGPAPQTDQLTTGLAPCTTLAACQTNLNQVGALSLSPFINKTLAGTANAGGGKQAPVVGAATTNGTVTAQSTSGSSGAAPFEVDAAAGTGEDRDSINSIIIALPNISGITFSGSSPATQTSPNDPQHVNIINQVRLNGNKGVGNPNCVKSINLAPPSVQCLQIFFSIGDSQGAAFVAGQSVTFNLALNKDFATILANDLLDGTQFSVITSTVNTSAAYSTTSLFGPVFDNQIPPNIIGFAANSQNPTFGTPNQINPNFINKFVAQLGPQLSKCTPPFIGSGKNQQCPGSSLPKLDSNIPSNTACMGSGVPCND